MKSKGKSYNFSKSELSDHFKNLASANESDGGNASEIDIEDNVNLIQDIDNILNRAELNRNQGYDRKFKKQ